MNIFIFYIIGFLIGYYCPKLLPGYPRGKQSWGDIRLRLFVALFSWLGVGVYFIMYLKYNTFKRIKNSSSQPPRWL